MQHQEIMEVESSNMAPHPLGNGALLPPHPYGQRVFTKCICIIPQCFNQFTPMEARNKTLLEQNAVHPCVSY